MKIRELRPGMKFRDNINGEVKWTDVKAVNPCPRIPTKTHVNSTQCWDSDYPVEVQPIVSTD